MTCDSAFSVGPRCSNKARLSVSNVYLLMFRQLNFLVILRCTSCFVFLCHCVHCNIVLMIDSYLLYRTIATCQKPVGPLLFNKCNVCLKNAKNVRK